jgi:hypothetical protein
MTGDASLEKDVVSHVLRRNSTDPSSTSDSLALSPDAVAFFHAEKLLSARPSFPLSEFTAEWKRSLPHQLTSYAPPPSLLSTLATSSHDPKIGDDVLSYFPAAALPPSPAARLAALFAHLPAWDVAAVGPYLEGALGEGEKVEALLLKHAVFLKDEKGEETRVGPKPEV